MRLWGAWKLHPWNRDPESGFLTPVCACESGPYITQHYPTDHARGSHHDYCDFGLEKATRIGKSDALHNLSANHQPDRTYGPHKEIRKLPCCVRGEATESVTDVSNGTHGRGE